MNPICFRCQKPKPILYRTTPYGTIPANFTCLDCLSAEESAAIDPQVDEITRLIANNR